MSEVSWVVVAADGPWEAIGHLCEGYSPGQQLIVQVYRCRRRALPFPEYNSRLAAYRRVSTVVVVVTVTGDGRVTPVSQASCSARRPLVTRFRIRRRSHRRQT